MGEACSDFCRKKGAVKKSQHTEKEAHFHLVMVLLYLVFGEKCVFHNTGSTDEFRRCWVPEHSELTGTQCCL